MSDLIVIDFDRADEAHRALEDLRNLQHTGYLHITDSAVIVKASDGSVHVNNQVSDATKTGALIGGALGVVLSFIFPVAGLVIGAAGGALVGASLDRHVDQQFVRDVTANLQAGHSALFLLIDGTPDAIVAALQPYRGPVYQTTLSQEDEAEIQYELRG